MYSANKRQRKFKLIFKFSLFTIPFIFAIAFLIYYLFFRPAESSSSFAKNNSQIAEVSVATHEFSNDLFKISLPTGWVDHGKQNPYTNQVYYEYQSAIKDNDNRWVRVYVDVFPPDFALNRLLPVDVSQNRIIPSNVSEDCTTFTGAPSESKSAGQSWSAKWQGVTFYCAVTLADNYIGTASQDEGYGLTLKNSNGATHKYFFVYIDRNVKPDYQIFIDAVKSFQTQ